MQRILIVDDEANNLKILKRDLEGEGYHVTAAEDGEAALEILRNDTAFDAILLDRMMPGMDGIEALKVMKQDEALRGIPVIMQTAASATREVQEGIEAGAYYYLTKPFEKTVMLAIVRRAIHDAQERAEDRREVQKQKRALGLMQYSGFTFRTLEEVKNLAYLLANGFPEPQRVIMGIHEMMLNAIEHGNLGLCYEDKKGLLLDNGWQAEIEARLAHPEFADKRARVRFDRFADRLELRIADEGKGFDPKPYLELSTDRATDPNGRGIALARMGHFDQVDYQGRGNEVVCTVWLDKEND